MGTPCNSAQDTTLQAHQLERTGALWAKVKWARGGQGSVPGTVLISLSGDFIESPSLPSYQVNFTGGEIKAWKRRLLEITQPAGDGAQVPTWKRTR